MKGIVFNLLEEVVRREYGEDTWDSLLEAAKHFYVISTGWFESRYLPPSWWPKYIGKKLLRSPHWQVAQTILLSHPGCLLSCHRPYATMLEKVMAAIRSQHLTVLVTHWWEYFRNYKPDDPFIAVLHQVADYLAASPDLQVCSFGDVASGKVPVQS